MPLASKISISLPKHLLVAAERARESRGESRSEFFRRAVEELLRQERERREVACYVEGYVAEPETTAEVEAIDHAGRGALDEDSWD